MLHIYINIKQYIYIYINYVLTYTVKPIIYAYIMNFKNFLSRTFLHFNFPRIH
jgi:hypothetical protein